MVNRAESIGLFPDALAVRLSLSFWDGNKQDLAGFARVFVCPRSTLFPAGFGRFHRLFIFLKD